MGTIDEFRAAVRKHFAFLSKHGFLVPTEKIAGDACWITYSTEAISLMLCFGPPEFEAAISFWRNDAPEIPLGPGDLTVVGQQPAWWKGAPGTEGLERSVSYLASAVHSVEEQVCSGDVAFYEQLTSARRVRIKEWVHAEQLQSVRARAEVAWQKKHYSEVASLYASMRTDLTPVEAKRLHYSESQLAR